MKKTWPTLAVLILVSTASLYAFHDDEKNSFQAVPFVFVGSASECAPSPAGSRIVTSTWLNGMGLPDNGTANPDANDPHDGLLLSKNGPTPNCSAAGARITGVAGMQVTQLGFDYRNGTHCGAGAPRFNLVTSDKVFHFVGGCANGTKTPAPQDTAHWTRVRFDPSNPAQAFPPVAPGAKIKTLSIIYDEGTDTPTTEDPRGVGLSVIDNIDVNGQLITHRPPRRDNDRNDDDD